MKKNIKKAINNQKLVLIITATIITLMLVLTFTMNNNYSVDQRKMALEYSKLSINNRFEYVGADEVLEVLNDGTGVIFFGFPECPWCQNTAPILNKAAIESGVKKILYYNPLEIRSENTPKYQQMVKILNKYLTVDENNQKRLFVPDIYIVKQGRIVAHVNDMSKPGDDVNTYFTNKKRSQLLKTYKEALNKL